MKEKKTKETEKASISSKRKKTEEKSQRNPKLSTSSKRKKAQQRNPKKFDFLKKTTKKT